MHFPGFPDDGNKQCTVEEDLACHTWSLGMSSLCKDFPPTDKWWDSTKLLHLLASTSEKIKYQEEVKSI